MDKGTKNYKFKSNKDKKIYVDKQHGITLIALAITIAVLIILAGITIGAITGDNGIINQAQDAKDDTQYASWEEQIDVAIIDAENKYRNPSWDNVIEELKNKEIIDDESQVDKKTGSITTNEPSYVIEGKLDDYIEFGPGMIADKNETYTDANGDTATIPEGFEILEDASTVDDGLVIQDEQGNQFVWIPVETPVSDTEEDGTENKAMAIKNGDNYRGLLYDFTSSASTVQSGCTTTTSNYREPDIVRSYDNNTSYNNGLFTKDSLQEEYNKMMASVEKYHGFYVGRYELGLEGTTPVSKNASTNSGVTTAAANNSNTYRWYGLYSKCKEFAEEESDKSVVSTMIWGSQYDAMMNWMQANGVDVSATADGTNTIKNSSSTTGGQEKDFIKNVFDIYGCHREWTLEAYNANNRVSRGGESGNSYSPSNHINVTPNTNASRYSARLTLYIK